MRTAQLDWQCVDSSCRLRQHTYKVLGRLRMDLDLDVAAFIGSVAVISKMYFQLTRAETMTRQLLRETRVQISSGTGVL